MNLRIVEFTPKPKIAPLTEPQELELLDLFRQAINRDVILEAARHVVERERPRPLEVWMKIARLHEGRIRKFWCDVPRTHLDCKRQELHLESIEDVRTMAADYLDEFLSSRRIPEREVLTFETTVADSTGYRECFARRGRYRVDVHGLSKPMAQLWMMGGGA